MKNVKNTHKMLKCFEGCDIIITLKENLGKTITIES